MDIRKLVTVILLGLVASAQSYADITDSLYSIEAIEVRGNRVHYFQAGAAIHEIDSTLLDLHSHESIGMLLNNEAQVQLKSYGAGGLATISIRGGADHHTSVVWNNINLQSPMNGGVNFSTLPTCFVDRVFLQTGGASTLFGSGTSTGSVHLIEQNQLNKGLTAEVSGFAGSANNYINSGKISYSNTRIASSLKYFVQHNENDFRYRNVYKYEDPIERLEHGSFRQYGVAQNNKIVLNSKSSISTSIWWLDYYKEVPELMGSYKPSDAEQWDKNLLYSLEYNYIGSNWRLKLQSGGFYNQVLFFKTTEFNTIDNDNNSFTYLNLAEFKVNLPGNFSLGLIAEQKKESGNSGAYNTQHIRDIYSGVGMLNYTSQKFTAVLTMRQEMINGDFIPFVFSFGTDYLLSTNLHWTTLFSKNYALPTFNDLYWSNEVSAKGNPTLQPESGWSAETGIIYASKGNVQDFSMEGHYYFSLIDNWIKWIEDSSQVWSPYNFQEAISQGAEVKIQSKRSFEKFDISLQAQYSYNRSYVTKLEDAVITDRKQMWYVPKHTAMLTANLFFKRIRFTYNQSLTSARTTDNSGRKLDAYSLGNVSFHYQLPMNKKALRFYFKINNIWNTEYELMKAYAMPLRQYMIGIKLIIN